MRPALAIAAGFARSLHFSGRATRPEFWWPVLFAVVLLAIATLVSMVAMADDPTLAMLMAFLIGIAPLPAAGMRRISDTAERLGWLFAGPLAVIWLAALPCLGLYIHGALNPTFLGTDFLAALFFALVLLPATALLLLAFILPLTRPTSTEQPFTVPTA